MIGGLNALGEAVPKGGSRPNSGRKAASKAGPAIVFSGRIVPELNDEAMALITRRGWSKTDLLSVALRAYLDSEEGRADFP